MRVEHVFEKMDDNVKQTVYRMLGQRAQQEDAWTTEKLQEGVYFHGVFDGHGGKIISNQAASILPSLLRKNLTDCKDLFDVEAVTAIITEAFLETDKLLYHQSLSSQGSTCSAVLTVKDTTNNKRGVYFMQLGDSRAALFDSTKVVFKTQDHKPNEANEKIRIGKAGGYVTSNQDAPFYMFGRTAPARVCGVLATSRSFGDWSIEERDMEKDEDGRYTYVYPKACAENRARISKEPVVTFIDLNPFVQTDVCIMICSDGLTDMYEEETVRQFVYDEERKEFNAEKAEERLMNSVLFNDNVTVMFIYQTLP